MEDSLHESMIQQSGRGQLIGARRAYTVIIKYCTIIKEQECESNLTQYLDPTITFIESFMLKYCVAVGASPVESRTDLTQLFHPA